MRHLAFRTSVKSRAFVQFHAEVFEVLLSKDLFVIEEGNPSYVGDKEKELVNVEKLRLVHQTIRQYYTLQKGIYNIEPTLDLQLFFSKIADFVDSEKDIYKKSLVILPKGSQ